MRFEETKIPGSYLISLDTFEDHRGSFARLWCRDTFTEAGLEADFLQANRSRSRQKGTLRGLHFQEGEAAEDKLVYCVKGSIFDVIVDLRPQSKQFLEWTSVELSEEDDSLFYLPKGCAHGFLTMADDTEIHYFATSPYSPDHERGIRYNDPQFNIEWPIVPQVLSEKDASWPDFQLDEVAQPSRTSSHSTSI